MNSFTGQTFQEVQNAFCRLVDETNGQELARYTLAGGGAAHGPDHGQGAPRGPGLGDDRHRHLANGRTFQDPMPRDPAGPVAAEAAGLRSPARQQSDMNGRSRSRDHRPARMTSRGRHHE